MDKPSFSTDVGRLAGADICGGYGGLQPGVFFLKNFFTPVIKPSPPLSPATLNTQPPHLARPLSTPSPQIQRIPSLSQTILGGRRPECRFPHDLIRGIWFSLSRSCRVVLSGEFPFPTIHFAFARILAFTV